MCKIWQYVAMVCFFLFIAASLTTGRYYILYHQSQEDARNGVAAWKEMSGIWAQRFKDECAHSTHQGAKYNALLGDLKEHWEKVLKQKSEDYDRAVLYIKQHLNVDFDPKWE